MLDNYSTEIVREKPEPVDYISVPKNSAFVVC